jgi:hypothetical protein
MPVLNLVGNCILNRIKDLDKSSEETNAVYKPLLQSGPSPPIRAVSEALGSVNTEKNILYQTRNYQGGKK